MDNSTNINIYVKKIENRNNFYKDGVLCLGWL